MNVPHEASFEYRLEPAAREDIAWIAQQEAAVYSPALAVPQKVLEEWYGASPQGFSVLKCDGHRVGHVNILAPSPNVLRNFLYGGIVEREIRGSDLYSAAERHAIRDLYVESVAIEHRAAHSNVAALRVLLTSFNDLIRRICDPERLENLYALAATPSGNSLLRHLG